MIYSLCYPSSPYNTPPSQENLQGRKTVISVICGLQILLSRVYNLVGLKACNCLLVTRILVQN